MDRLVNTRADRRHAVGLPAMIGGTSEVSGDFDLGMGLLEEESDGGARFILDNPLAPGAEISWAVPGTGITGKGVVVFSRSLESRLRPRFVVGVQRSAPALNRFATIRRWLIPARKVAHPAT
jgi:hypothetical protein